MPKQPIESDRRYLWSLALIASLGGFLFGYDTAVISGTIGFVKAKFGLDAVMEGWYVSSALVGCITGVLLAGPVSDWTGRKRALILSAALFTLGVYGLLARRNAVTVLLAVELMLAAVNINLVAFEAFWRNELATGQVFAIFVITVAAAEVGIGLAIILMIFRNRTSGNVDELDLMKW